MEAHPTYKGWRLRVLHYNALPAAAKIDTWRLYKTPSALAFPSAKKSSKTTNSSPFFVYLKIIHINGLPNIYILQGTSLTAKCFINFYSKQVPSFSFLSFKSEAFTYKT